jgi:hypothetical protein
MTVAIDTIPQLLATIEHLPSDQRATYLRRVDAAIARPAPAARVALGLLALELAANRTVARAAQLGASPEVLIELPEPSVAVEA